MRVTRYGEPAVVMISDDDYELLLETITVLSDRELVAELARADRDVEGGAVHTLDEVTAAGAAWQLIHGPLRATPHRVGEPLRAPFDGQHVARRSTYRVFSHRRHTPHGDRPGDQAAW